MPREKQAKIYCVDNLRHAEYYQMQEYFDNLYAESLVNKEFTNLMDYILDRENILLHTEISKVIPAVIPQEQINLQSRISEG